MGLNTADVAYKPADQHATDTQTAATVTATQSAPGAGKRLLIAGYSISASAAPTTAGVFLVKNGTTTIARLNIPTGAVLQPVVVQLKRPWPVDINTAASATCGTLGASVVCTIDLHTLTVPGL